jgi:hypothetical protein
VSSIISAAAGFTLAETLRAVGGCNPHELEIIAQKHAKPLEDVICIRSGAKFMPVIRSTDFQDELVAAYGSEAIIFS